MSVSLHEEGAVLPGTGAGPVPNTEREKASRAVVFIDTQSVYGKGSGFLAKLSSQADDRALLVTCNHVIPDKKIAKSCLVFIDRLDDDTPGREFSGMDLFDLSSFKTDETDDPKWRKLLDFTIIVVKMDVLSSANLPNGPPTPLTITDVLCMTDELQEKDTISVVHYPKWDFKKCTNPQHILKIEGPMFGHSATTEGGSSGCPVFREFEEQWVVVGLHRGELPLGKTILTNVATFMSAILDVYLTGQPYSGQAPDITEFAHAAHDLIPNSSNSSNGDHSVLSTNVYAVDNTGPMKKWNSSALTALKGELKRKVIVKNGLNNILETDAGGFMNEAEAQMVESMPNNAEQMGEIIQILLGKSNAAFETFCKMLREVGYDVWATALEDKAKEQVSELEKEAREFKRKST